MARPVRLAEEAVDKNGLDGKFAVVTGGTQGLGESIARLFVARGAAGVVVCGRNAARGEAVAKALGAKSRFVQAELSRVEDCRRVIAEADRAFGRLDILVNAAAITDRGTILDTSPELFDAMFAVNVRAPFFLMQDAAKLMRRERVAGTIVNIQSMSAHGGQSFITAYCASKGALATLTKNVAFSLMPDRIRVNGLNIGWMDSPGETAIQQKYHNADADWLAKAEAKQPFGRLIKPDEVARTVAFLASDESGLMTGSIIDFDQQIMGAGDAPSHPVQRLAA
jgi:NAD(P)-dependent dehydrogenase (short-subunit alcohol dehydrogenase family)